MLKNIFRKVTSDGKLERGLGRDRDNLNPDWTVGGKITTLKALSIVGKCLSSLSAIVASIL